jgi:hypothetical protein
MTLPTTLRAGDTYSQLVPLAAYPASVGWVLKARFTPRAGGSAIQITGSAEGDDHRLQATAAATAAWVAGDYAAVQWVEKAADVHTVASGQISVLPNLRAILGATDTRSQAEIALAAAKAALAAWTPTQRRYRIGEREMEFNSTGEIIKLITYWEGQVSNEAVLAGRATKPGRRIFSRI